MKFRKRPVVIEAVKYTGRNASEVMTTLGMEEIQEDFTGGLTIRTLEGEMRAEPGDWIIGGVKGEFYPCKPDIFEATYEAVDE